VVAFILRNERLHLTVYHWGTFIASEIEANVLIEAAQKVQDYFNLKTSLHLSAPVTKIG
jgi:hypothetical protein